MKQRFAIVDTNILVSALISADSSAAVCQIVDNMLEARFAYLLSPDLLAEYRQVLLRPRVKKYHGLNKEEVDNVLETLAGNVIWREPKSVVDAPDPNDNHLWALLHMQPNAVLVTGDRLLIEANDAPGLVVLPRVFLDQLLV